VAGHCRPTLAIRDLTSSRLKDSIHPETVGLNCVPTCQREAERSGRIQRDAGELLVKWIVHAED
jgi:hypothetical protein